MVLIILFPCFPLLFNFALPPSILPHSHKHTHVSTYMYTYTFSLFILKLGPLEQYSKYLCFKKSILSHRCLTDLKQCSCIEEMKSVLCQNCKGLLVLIATEDGSIYAMAI